MKFFPGRPLSPRGGGGGGPVLAGRHCQGVVQQPQQLAVALRKAWKGKGGICKGVESIFLWEYFTRSFPQSVDLLPEPEDGVGYGAGNSTEI